MSTEQKRMLIDRKQGELSISRQCELLQLPCSSLYYESTRDEGYNEQLMRLIDEQYTRTPFYGVPRMTAWLRQEGHEVNPKRIRRLMRQMGLEAIYPKPRLSRGVKEHHRYPYLLKGLNIETPNQVWATDITYFRLSRGFVYLVAIMDWFSRYVVSWEVSVTLEAAFCLAALERALETALPEIFNSDQGVQFTSEDFTDLLDSRGIRISMDGRGRCFDNIVVERLWRSVKYEEVYLNDYRDVKESIRRLGIYFEFYNHERLHQALDYQTPAEVYYEHSKN
jgi:putative transposase